MAQEGLGLRQAMTNICVVVALAVACRDVDVRTVKALIIGPHETPYQFGFFEVLNDHVWS